MDKIFKGQTIHFKRGEQDHEARVLDVGRKAVLVRSMRDGECYVVNAAKAILRGKMEKTEDGKDWKVAGERSIQKLSSSTKG